MSPPDETSAGGEGAASTAGDGTTVQRPVAALHSADEGGAPVPPARGLTIEQYAEGKKLGLEFLRELGLSTIHIPDPCVRIPYFNLERELVAVRRRHSLHQGQGPKFTWNNGATPQPYGQERLSAARDAGLIFLVEGESDAHTLWQHNVPALGIPGARA